MIEMTLLPRDLEGDLRLWCDSNCGWSKTTDSVTAFGVWAGRRSLSGDWVECALAPGNGLVHTRHQTGLKVRPLSGARKTTAASACTHTFEMEKGKCTKIDFLLWAVFLQLL
jgi:hypothetical protein